MLEIKSGMSMIKVESDCFIGRCHRDIENTLRKAHIYKYMMSLNMENKYNKSRIKTIFFPMEFC